MKSKQIICFLEPEVLVNHSQRSHLLKVFLLNGGTQVIFLTDLLLENPSFLTENLFRSQTIC